MVKNITILNALGPFLSRPNEKLHLAMISSELKKPHTTVRQWLNFLEKKGILKKGIQGRLTLYNLNYKNPNIIDYLVIAEKNKLIELCEKNLQLKELVDFIYSAFKEDSKAVIFGSAAISPKIANDTDLLVVGAINEEDIKKISSKLNKNIHLIRVKSLAKVSKSLKAEIIKKHIIIKGSEDIIRWILW